MELRQQPSLEKMEKRDDNNKYHIHSQSIMDLGMELTL